MDLSEATDEGLIDPSNNGDVWDFAFNAGHKAGYIQGLIAASNAAATEHDTLGWEGAVRAIEKRLSKARQAES